MSSVWLRCFDFFVHLLHDPTSHCLCSNTFHCTTASSCEADTEAPSLPSLSPIPFAQMYACMHNLHTSTHVHTHTIDQTRQDPCPFRIYTHTSNVTHISTYHAFSLLRSYEVQTGKTHGKGKEQVNSLPKFLGSFGTVSKKSMRKVGSKKTLSKL